MFFFRGKKVTEFMHYNGPIIRPPHEAGNAMLEITVGCTHNSCRFCTFYKGINFQMASLAQVELDLREVASVNPDVLRIWASGGDPFTMHTEYLERLAKLVQKYLPKASIGMYARVDSTFHKSVEELSYIRSLGIDDIVIGIESGDDAVLKKMNKGYTAAQIINECKKLEAAGIVYRIIYLAGIAGHDLWRTNAIKTANLLNQLHPVFMYMTSLTIQEDSLLYQDVLDGAFKPQEEREIIEEFCTLIQHLKNPIEIDARAGYNPVHFRVNLPETKEAVVKKLNTIIENYDKAIEHRLKSHRASFDRV